jgi:hypothetical protein
MTDAIQAQIELLRRRRTFSLNGATWIMLNEPDPDCQAAANTIERLAAALKEAEKRK